MDLDSEGGSLDSSDILARDAARTLPRSTVLRGEIPVNRSPTVESFRALLSGATKVSAIAFSKKGCWRRRQRKSSSVSV